MNTFALAVFLMLFPGLWQNNAAQSPAQSSPPASSSSSSQLSQRGIDRIVKEVHHELVLLPFYGVFDNLAYKVDPDGTVTLLGQVA
ncbi:MAG: hyperosmotically inducible periplasmic protein, partial [Acidobacteriaceae bacterium]